MAVEDGKLREGGKRPIRVADVPVTCAGPVRTAKTCHGRTTTRQRQERRRRRVGRGGQNNSRVLLHFIYCLRKKDKNI